MWHNEPILLKEPVAAKVNTEMQRVLEAHACIIESKKSRVCLISFPEGSTLQEVHNGIQATSYHVKLPDGLIVLMQTLDTRYSYDEYAIISAAQGDPPGEFDWTRAL